MVEALFPERYPNKDFFICDILDAIPKDDMGSMEHPMFTLAKRPDFRTLEYTNGRTQVVVRPSHLGLATVFDKDVLIYCISQLMAKKDRGEPVGPRLVLRAHDLLIATNRQTGGESYQRLKATFQRLKGTVVETNIEAGKEREEAGFGFISEWRIITENDSGRMLQMEVELCPWLFRAAMAKEVLTIHRDYFRLRKPIERRIYEIARKHCGRQREWRIGVRRLFEKTGSSNGTMKNFRRSLKHLVLHDHLPDYSVRMDGDMVVFTSRSPLVAASYRPSVDGDAYDEVRAIFRAKGLQIDPYALEDEWITFWRQSGGEKLYDPTRAFIGFAMARADARPARDASAE